MKNCGTEIDMKLSDSKKVFLSHKGVDKEFAIDFRRPWNFWATIRGSMKTQCQLARHSNEGFFKACKILAPLCFS